MEILHIDNQSCKYYKENFYAQIKMPEDCEIFNAYEKLSILIRQHVKKRLQKLQP
jgi:hypothetical protein